MYKTMTAEELVVLGLLIVEAAQNLGLKPSRSIGELLTSIAAEAVEKALRKDAAKIAAQN